VPNDSQQSGSSLLQAVIVILLAGGSGYLYYQTLSSTRPDETEDSPFTSYGIENVAARPWEDPFKACLDASAEGTTEPIDTAAAIQPSFSTAGTRPSGAGTESTPKPPPEHDLGEVTQQIKLNLHTPQFHQLVLGVLVSGSQYSELHEQRLRTRVAILEGLARCGYQAEDEDRIGYVNLPWRHSTDQWFVGGGLGQFGPLTKWLATPQTGPPPPPLVIPYEWWDLATLKMAGKDHLPSPPQMPNRVLVVWINEDAVADYPLSRLAALVWKIRHDSTASARSCPATNPSLSSDSTADNSLTFEVIGPNTSNVLREMVCEARWGKKLGLCNTMLAGIRMYAANATAADAILLAHPPDDDNPDPAHPTGQTVADLLQQKTGIELIRTTRTDRESMNALVDELQLRLAPQTERHWLRNQYDMPEEIPSSQDDQSQSFDPASTFGHIAVISEWDTYYGRALPLSFAQAYLAPRDLLHIGPDGAADLDQAMKSWPPTLHPFFYLRGIDGRGPRNAAGAQSGPSPQASGASADAANRALRFDAPGEKPEGTNQSDYLRRLSIDLSKLDDQLRNTDGRGLKAIVILGTDIYDKLMVLSALRDEFPGMLFCTLGLDANYSLPSEWKNTRNLVVISPFGLDLADEYQFDVPRFRDSYQTSEFLAVLAALKKVPCFSDEQSDSWSVKKACVQMLGAPRRFEIGRTEAVDMSIEFGTESSVQNSQSQKSAIPEEWRNVAVVTLLAIACIVLMRIFRMARRDFTYSLWFIGSAVAAVWLAWFALARDGTAGQPMTVSQAVSLWPTDLLRILAGGLAVFFFVTGWRNWESNDLDLESWFNLKDLLDSEKAPADPLKGLLDRPKYPLFNQGRINFEGWRERIGIHEWAVFGIPDDKKTPAKDGTRLEAASEPFIAKSRTDWRDVKVYAQNVWWEYQYSARMSRRVVRAAIMTAIYFVLCWLILLLVNNSDFGLRLWEAPTRGYWSSCVELLIDIFSAVASVFLLFFVLDAAILNRKLIHYILRADTYWPEHAWKIYLKRAAPLLPEGQLNIDPTNMNDYLDIRFIAMRTYAVGTAVYEPFLIFLLLIVARTSYFEDWQWPLQMDLIMSMNILLSFAAAYLLRDAAEGARKTALRNLRTRAVVAQTTDKKSDADALNRMIERVTNEKEGAFSIFSQYPRFYAILLSISSLAIPILLRFIAQYVN